MITLIIGYAKMNEVNNWQQNSITFGIIQLQRGCVRGRRIGHGLLILIAADFGRDNVKAKAGEVP